MKKFFYVFLLFLIVINLSYRLDEIRGVKEKVEEILYLPKGEILKYIALDHRNTLSDYFWLLFIQYYGHHLQTDLQFPYLYPITNIITDLDEKFLHAYTFGSVNIAHHLKDKLSVTKLLMKAMYKNPEKWEYPFWMGFLNYVFFKDYKTAGIFFKLSTFKKDAPPVCYRFYAFTYYKKLKNLEIALKLWEYMYNSVKSEVEKEIAKDYIKRTIMKIHMRDLNILIKKFKEKEGYSPLSLRELLEKGYIKEIPKHPYDGYYIIRGDTVESIIPKR
ncbi:MAG: hypothetical protein ABIM78_00505 [candidate division WOR-3 bacterium]